MRGATAWSDKTKVASASAALVDRCKPHFLFKGTAGVIDFVDLVLVLKGLDSIERLEGARFSPVLPGARFSREVLLAGVMLGARFSRAVGRARFSREVVLFE